MTNLFQEYNINLTDIINNTDPGIVIVQSNVNKNNLSIVLSEIEKSLDDVFEVATIAEDIHYTKHENKNVS